jgi:hypothetical protein
VVCPACICSWVNVILKVATYLNLWTWPNGGKYFAFNYISISIVIGLMFQLQLKHLLQLQPTMIRVAIDVHFELQIVNILSPVTVLPLQLQPDNGSSCNQSTLRVAIKIHSKLQILSGSYLILYYPFSCNPIVIRVAIDIHSELQILYYPFSYNPIVVQVAIDIHSKSQILSVSYLILYYPFSCNPIVVRVAIDIHYELQILNVSALYYTTPLVATERCLRCNLYTL